MTSSEAIPMRTSSWWPSPRSEATTTCFGRSPGLRPSVMAMSMSGTMMPRKLKIPTRYAGARGSLVSSGQSKTSSTSSTGKQKRSRPLRNTQYCNSGGRSSIGPSASSSSPVSASAGSGVRWNSSFITSVLSFKPLGKSAHSAQQVFPRERLRHVPVRALLLAPELVARRVLGSHHNHRNLSELRTVFQVPAHLESVTLRHHHVQQDHRRPDRVNRFFNESRVAQSHGAIALAFQQALDQLHLRWRVIHYQYFFQLSHAHSTVLHGPEVPVSSQHSRLAGFFAPLVP